MDDLLEVVKHENGLRDITDWEVGFIVRLSHYGGPLSVAQRSVVWCLWCDLCYEMEDDCDT